MDEGTAALLAEILSQTIETKLMVKALTVEEEEECCAPEAEETINPMLESEMLDESYFEFGADFGFLG